MAPSGNTRQASKAAQEKKVQVEKKGSGGEDESADQSAVRRYCYTHKIGDPVDISVHFNHDGEDHEVVISWEELMADPRRRRKHHGTVCPYKPTDTINEELRAYRVKNGKCPDCGKCHPSPTYVEPFETVDIVIEVPVEKPCRRQSI